MRVKTALLAGILPVLGVFLLALSTPASATASPCVWGFSAGPPAQIVSPGSTNSYSYTLTWTSLPNPSSVALTTAILTPTTPGWSAAVTSTNPVSVTSTSGSTTVTVSVTAASISGSSATIEVIATDGTCVAQGTQYITTSFTALSVPEFGFGILGILGVGMLLIAFVKRSSLSFPKSNL